LRELDNLGVDWTADSGVGTPAGVAARFGRLGVLQWLGMKGALQGEHQVGWSNKGWGGADGTDPLILM
jgi:hypothetical protein